MTSIKARLLLILIAMTALVWLSAVAWIFLSTRAEVERVLDARLIESARMVNSLISERHIAAAATALDDENPETSVFEPGQQSYERQLSCQIWSLDGTLVGRSHGAPATRLTNIANGFSKTVIDGETWRVYAVENEKLGVRVMVGDNLKVRNGLVGDVIKGLTLPAVLILPVMIGLIWFSVRRGLFPLNTVAATLAKRQASDLKPLPDDRLPREIEPVIGALNGLFKRVEDARQRERSFTAFAAHELKTPLAGLKTQAQIALASNDGAVHANALRQISSGVDRTGRLVKQLLDLATLEANDAEPALSREDPAPLLAAVVKDLQPLAKMRAVDVTTLPSSGASVLAEPRFLELALRNILENAILHAPKNGSVICSLHHDDDGISIRVEDDGPGIAEKELPHATERFFRGSNRSETGSGLGLSIVELAMSRMGGGVRLANRARAGLAVSLVFPRAVGNP